MDLWNAECEVLAEDVTASPAWTPHGVPRCPRDESCAQYDGKRCRAMGQRPHDICEPCVERMAELLGPFRRSGPAHAPGHE
jgi:hypothetical protein